MENKDFNKNKLIEYWITGSDDTKKQLVTITAFNINARYDDYKMSFKKKCSTEFTEEWIENFKELRLWIKTLIQQ